jgi:hypothetical protein
MCELQDAHRGVAEVREAGRKFDRRLAYRLRLAMTKSII